MKIGNHRKKAEYIGLRVPEPLRRELARISTEENVPISEVVRRILTNRVDIHDVEIQVEKLREEIRTGLWKQSQLAIRAIVTTEEMARILAPKQFAELQKTINQIMRNQQMSDKPKGT